LEEERAILLSSHSLSFFAVTLETILTCGVTACLTLYWYFSYRDDESFDGKGTTFILLAFAVTPPSAVALSMAFQRREQALNAMSDFRAVSYHLYLAHSMWKWDSGKDKRNGDSAVDWLEHCDAVLAQLIGIGDELARFLSLPTFSRARHKMTRRGRREATQTVEVAYHLLESMTTQRMTRLVLYGERLKDVGMGGAEAAAMRDYARKISDLIEDLRMFKEYRTPMAFRSFARIFSLLLPPFFAPTYAQAGMDLNSWRMGITFGLITAVALTALFESLNILEDPFTAFLALDGIDVREEFCVLHFAQLINTRKLIFPDAPAYPTVSRAAITTLSKQDGIQLHTLGVPPMQVHNYEPPSHERVHTWSDVPLKDLPKELPEDLSGPVLEDLKPEQMAPILQSFEDTELGKPLETEQPSHLRKTSYGTDLKAVGHRRMWSRGFHS
jgi:hypothetical protein